MQDFKVKVNEFDSLLSEKTGLIYDLKLSGKHQQDVEFVSKTNEGIDVLLKINRSNFLENSGKIQWKYCADPSSDYWVYRNSNDLVSLTNDFHNILKDKMFDKEYLSKLSKKD